MTASAAKVGPSLPQAQAPAAGPAATPVRRRSRWSLLELLRETLGGALLLVVWIALWTVTWAAVAGPLSPVHAEGARAAAVSAEPT